VHIEVGGVDDLVGNRHQGSQQLAFKHDGVVQRETVMRERMAPAGIRKALQQHVVAGVEKDQLVSQPEMGDAREHGRQFLQVVLAIAHVDADRESRVVALRAHRIDEGGQQGGRQVVDAV
jgi:hypothetical protein